MKNHEDKLTVSSDRSEINYIAKKLGVKPWVILYSKSLVGNKRKDITEWVNHNKNGEVTVTIE